MKKTFASAMVCLMLLACSVRADDATSQPAVLGPADTAALKEAVGKKVTVKGEISKVYSGKTIMILDFKESRDFTAVIRKVDQDAVNAAFSGDVAAALKGKTVKVTGEIKLYKEKPQIEITKPDQIELESK